LHRQLIIFRDILRDYSAMEKIKKPSKRLSNRVLEGFITSACDRIRTSDLLITNGTFNTSQTLIFSGFVFDLYPHQYPHAFKMHLLVYF
jgi:hypothetical protein